jgi:hypothetical protein
VLVGETFDPDLATSCKNPFFTLHD